MWLGEKSNFRIWVLMLQSKTLRFIRRLCQTCTALFLITLVLLSAGLVSAQNAPSPRKLIYKVTPKYPRELKQNEIGGVVRLLISVSPNGSVASISTIGGNPILVDAATMAVKQWKYVPTDHTTMTEVRLDFVAH